MSFQSNKISGIGGSFSCSKCKEQYYVSPSQIKKLSFSVCGKCLKYFKRKQKEQFKNNQNWEYISTVLQNKISKLINSGINYKEACIDNNVKPSTLPKILRIKN